MKERQINEELVDVWAGMMAEKVSRAREKLAGTRGCVQSAGLAGFVDGLTQAMALMSSLEKCRFEKDHERLRKEMMADGRQRV